MKNSFPYIVSFISSFFAFYLNAQMLELPTERIYLSLNKGFYKIGDTVSVSAHLFGTGEKRPARSEYIYIELFNDQDSVLLSKKIKCVSGSAISFPLQLEYTWRDSILYLRAYTRLMQNFKPETFPTIEIPVGQPQSEPIKQTSGIKCSFFPEGGQWINGEIQNMTLYLTDHFGAPLSVPFHILNHTDTVAYGITSPSGLQTIRLQPEEEDEFRLSAYNEGERFSFLLPPREKEGLVIQAVINRNKIYYKVLSRKKAIGKKRLFVYCAGLGLEEIGLTEKQCHGIISIAEEDGLFVLMLTDQKGEIISQTALWRKEIQPIFFLNKKEYAPNERLHLQTALPDSLHAYRTYFRIIKRNQRASSAITQSVLGSEIISPVPFPLSYLVSPTKETYKEVEAWMRTVRLASFHLPDMIQEDFRYRYQPETVLQFTGTVMNPGNKPLKGGTIIAYNAETMQVSEGKISESGHYAIPVPDFLEGSHFFLQAHPAKDKADFYIYIPDDDTIPPIINLHRQEYVSLRNPEMETHSQNNTKILHQVDEEENPTYIMPEIIVKARSRQEKSVSTEKFYKTNYMDEETIKKRNYSRLEDIIADIPGISIVYGDGKGSKPLLKGQRGISVLHGGETSGIPILVDGMRMELQEAFHLISPHQIRSVEFLKPSQTNAVTFGAIEGALCITTQGRQKDDIISKGFLYDPQGLSHGNAYMEKRTYSPSYPGEYELLVDVVTQENAVYSYRIPFSVKTDK